MNSPQDVPVTPISLNVKLLVIGISIAIAIQDEGSQIHVLLRRRWRRCAYRDRRQPNDRRARRSVAAGYALRPVAGDLHGHEKCAAITHALLAAGMKVSTPAAAIQNATRADQREVISTLAHLTRDVENADLGSPAVVVIGDVVGLAARVEIPLRQTG